MPAVCHTTTDLAFCPGSKLTFVPVLEPGQGFRDKSLSRLLSRVEEPGQKVPDVKIFFAHHGIRSQDLLPSAYFPCQLTMMEYEGLRVFWWHIRKLPQLICMQGGAF